MSYSHSYYTDCKHSLPKVQDDPLLCLSYWLFSYLSSMTGFFRSISDIYINIESSLRTMLQLLSCCDVNYLVYSDTFTWLTKGAACTLRIKNIHDSWKSRFMVTAVELQGKQTSSILVHLLGNSQEVAGLCKENSYAVHDIIFSKMPLLSRWSNHHTRQKTAVHVLKFWKLVYMIKNLLKCS